MVALIFMKWIMPWQQGFNTCFAPSIIGIFINMALKPGTTDPVKDESDCSQGGTYALFGDLDGSDQTHLQSLFLLIALICVPIILIPKPLLEWVKHKSSSKHGASSHDNMSQQLLKDHDVYLPLYINPN
jgi:V-type H+-transporting ATPase subunit a